MYVRTSSTVGAAIRSRRRELKLDQERLAKKIGTTRQWVIAIEKGKDTAELGIVLRALAALDLQVTLSPLRTPTAANTPIDPLPTIDIDAIANATATRLAAYKSVKRSKSRKKARKKGAHRG